MTLLIKNLTYLVTCDDDNRILKEVNVFVEDGIIKSIGNDVQTADDVIDGSHMVMYPGLINTHHHLYQTFSRNLPEVQNMELFPWLKTLYEIWKNLNPDSVYYSSLTGMGELLKTGCTCCLDHHYVFPTGTGMDLLDSQFAAVDALGMRFHTTRGSASILGRDDIGQIAEGMAADFFMINMDRLALTGAQFDVSSMLGTVGFKGNVNYTVVNGKVVVREGRLTGVDEDKITEKANQCVTRYLGRS